MQTELECARPMGARAHGILDAARICFERYGFHAASMARIADEADISVGHIYRYFPNKEAVVAAIVSQDLDEISRDIDKLSGAAEELADHILKTFEGSRSRQKTILKLEVMAESARNTKVFAMTSAMDHRLCSRVQESIARALERQAPGLQLPPEEMEVRISLIRILVEGLQIRAFQEGDALPPGLTKQVRALLIQAFSAGSIEIDSARPGV